MNEILKKILFNLILYVITLGSAMAVAETRIEQQTQRIEQLEQIFKQNIQVEVASAANRAEIITKIEIIQNDISEIKERMRSYDQSIIEFYKQYELKPKDRFKNE